jgi:hypothetical protein
MLNATVSPVVTAVLEQPLEPPVEPQPLSAVPTVPKVPPIYCTDDCVIPLAGVLVKLKRGQRVDDPINIRQLLGIAPHLFVTDPAKIAVHLCPGCKRPNYPHHPPKTDKPAWRVDRESTVALVSLHGTTTFRPINVITNPQHAHQMQATGVGMTPLIEGENYFICECGSEFSAALNKREW